MTTQSGLKSKIVSVRMTRAMYANLRRLAGSERDVANEIRSAIRAYLDNQGEIAGSRRYFTGRFREEVRGLRRDVTWHLTLITVLLAESLSILIRASVEMDEETAKAFSPSGLLRIAEERTIDSGYRIRQRIETAIDAAEIEAQRQEDGGAAP